MKWTFSCLLQILHLMNGHHKIIYLLPLLAYVRSSCVWHAAQIHVLFRSSVSLKLPKSTFCCKTCHYYNSFLILSCLWTQKLQYPIIFHPLQVFLFIDKCCLHLTNLIILIQLLCHIIFYIHKIHIPKSERSCWIHCQIRPWIHSIPIIFSLGSQSIMTFFYFLLIFLVPRQHWVISGKE